MKLFYISIWLQDIQNHFIACNKIKQLWLSYELQTDGTDSKVVNINNQYQPSLL